MHVVWKASFEPIKGVRSWAVGHFLAPVFLFSRGGATGASRSLFCYLSAR